MTRKLEGVDVKNSGRRIRIDITEADIMKGKPLDPTACAAAQCIRRSLGASDVKVHRGVTYIKQRSDGPWTRYKTSEALRIETIVFDRGGQFIMGEYDLQPVPFYELTRPSKPKTPSRGRSPQEARRSQRRRIIPGVRSTARIAKEEEED